MSDTPRTDSIVTGNSNPSSDEYEDLATFTRQQERELLAVTAEREKDRANLFLAFSIVLDVPKDKFANALQLVEYVKALVDERDRLKEENTTARHLLHDSNVLIRLVKCACYPMEGFICTRCRTRNKIEKLLTP